MSPDRRPITAAGFVRPRGYEDAIRLEGATTVVALGGHVAFDGARTLLHPGDLVAQVRVTLTNLKATLAAAGFEPRELVKLTIYTTDVPGYRAHMADIGRAWQEVFGKFFPAMTLVGVSGLFEPGAVVEIDGWAAR